MWSSTRTRPGLPAFHTLAFTQRPNYASSLAACTACLTTNHPITWNDRSIWFATHAQSCNSDYLCEKGKCAKEEPAKRLHMVLCGQHIAENQGEIDAFKLTHQKYSNMKLYQLSSNLKKPVDLDLSEEREREGEGGSARVQG